MSSSLTIRHANERDASAIALIYAPFVTNTAVSFEEVPPTPEQVADRIRRSHLWLLAETEANVLGYAYAAPIHTRPCYRWSTEVSIYLAGKARGRGIGRRLLKSLLERTRAKGFVNAFAGIALPNPVSVSFFESFGFGQIAQQHNVGFKLGRWHDVGWWQLQLRDPSIPPPEIT